jgi:hypothetical protein
MFASVCAELRESMSSVREAAKAATAALEGKPVQQFKVSCLADTQKSKTGKQLFQYLTGFSSIQASNMYIRRPPALRGPRCL